MTAALLSIKGTVQKLNNADLELLQCYKKSMAATVARVVSFYEQIF